MKYIRKELLIVKKLNYRLIYFSCRHIHLLCCWQDIRSLQLQTFWVVYVDIYHFKIRYM